MTMNRPYLGHWKLRPVSGIMTETLSNGHVEEYLEALPVVMVGGSGSSGLPVEVESGWALNTATSTYIWYQRIYDETAGTWTTTWYNAPNGAVMPAPVSVAPVEALQNKDIEGNTIWTANIAGIGYAAGDTLERYVVYDRATNPITISYIWLNATQGTQLTTAPIMANLEYKGNNRDVENAKQFRAIVAGTGYSVGDYINLYEIINLATATPAYSQVWINQTTGLVLATAPVFNNLIDAQQLDNEECLGYQQLSVSTVAVALTIPAGVNKAVIRVQPINNSQVGAIVRYRLDGVAPLNTTGMPLLSWDVLNIIGQSDLTDARFISANGLTHTLTISYYRG